MGVRYILGVLSLVLLIASCEKTTMSKVPQITFLGFDKDSVRVNRDTLVMLFSLQDGDADLGVGVSSGTSDIFIKDFRFDTGYAGYLFPDDLKTAKFDPDKGISGKCYFLFTPDLLSPRFDSVHVLFGDTTHFEVYIKDKAGNESNHFITNDIVLTPR